METINIQKLKRDDLVSFYSAADLKWLPAQVIDMGLNYARLQALAGDIEGFSWTVSIQDMKNPELYQMYVPEPPKRKRRLFRFIRNLFKKKLLGK